MKITVGDFNDFKCETVLAQARHTQIKMIVNTVKGTVKYTVYTSLEDSPFQNKEEATMYDIISFIPVEFNDLETAIDYFNAIQELAENGKLVHITGA